MAISSCVECHRNTVSYANYVQKIIKLTFISSVLTVSLNSSVALYVDKISYFLAAYTFSKTLIYTVKFKNINVEIDGSSKYKLPLRIGNKKTFLKASYYILYYST